MMSAIHGLRHIKGDQKMSTYKIRVGSQEQHTRVSHYVERLEVASVIWQIMAEYGPEVILHIEEVRHD